MTRGLAPLGNSSLKTIKKSTGLKCARNAMPDLVSANEMINLCPQLSLLTATCMQIKGYKY